AGGGGVVGGRRGAPGRDGPGPPRRRVATRGRIRRMTEQTQAARTREINETVRYTMWSVFRLATAPGDSASAAEAAEVTELFEKLATEDVVVRGTYDVAGLRADAD